MKNNPLLLVALMLTASTTIVAQTDYLPPTAPYLLDLTPLDPPLRYLYSATGAMDGGRVIYSCSGALAQPNGDHIMRSVTTATPQIEGTAMTAPETVMGPRLWASWYGPQWQSLRIFDKGGVCDPTFVRVGSLWYLFMSGLNGGAKLTTSIGLARSYDGRNWEVWHPSGWRNERARQGPGAAILKSVERASGEQSYGTGQPSVAFVKPHFYLFYNDSQGFYYNQGRSFHPHGAGVFVLRSADPSFQTNAEALSAGGFVRLSGDINSPENQRIRTSYPLHAMGWSGPVPLEVSVADVQYSDMLSAFVLTAPASQNNHGVIQLFTYPDLARPATAGYQRILPADAMWQDNLGFVRRPDGHSLASTTCGHVPLEVVGNWINSYGLQRAAYWRAAGLVPGNENVYASRMAGVSTEIRVPMACANAVWPTVFDGYRLEQAGFPMSVAVDGTRLDLQRAAVAPYLSRNVIRNFTPTQFFSFSETVTMPSGARSVQPPGQPAGLVLTDGRVWLTNCNGLITANGSRWPAESVYAYPGPLGKLLLCLF